MKILLTTLALLFSSVTDAEILIVVGPDSPIESLSAKQVSNIFLAKTNHLDDIGRVTPLILKDSEDKNSFYRIISRKTSAQINSYWTALIFTGKGKPPREIKTRQQLFDELGNNPGAVTYLPAEQLSDRVKVVATLP